MKTISQAEKIDVLLTLALAFDINTGEPENSQIPQTVRELVESSLTAINSEDFEDLKTRAEFIDNLPLEHRERWQSVWLDKLRRRGRAIRLDENINPSHIVEVLSREPKTIQNLILRNLPADLSRRISLYLDLSFEPAGNSGAQNDKMIKDEMIALVREKFLTNFFGLEDIYEPDELDKFSFDELEKFIRHLGLREIAIACRGINSKETLAAFLNRFDEIDTREIAHYITELEKIRPFWVAQADVLVRKSWNADLPPEKVIKKIGFKLLAMVFAVRDETRRRYTAQKLSIRDVKTWQRLVRVSERKYLAAAGEEKLRLDKRRRIIERLALKFNQTGKL
jgi:hypothetical protein